MTRIAVVGDRDPAYVTHRELDAALERFPAGVEIGWMATTAIDLDGVDGVWLAPGTPYADDTAVYALLRHARENGLPLLGTCGGFQYALVEFARNVAGLDAAHAETDPDAAQLVVAPLACSLVGQERTVTCVPGTRLAELCGTAPFTGFHFCGFGLNPAYVAPLERAGLVVGAHADDAGVELPGHPFFVATLFQPQVGASRGGPLHPLLHALAGAAAAASAARAGGAATPAP